MSHRLVFSTCDAAKARQKALVRATQWVQETVTDTIQYQTYRSYEESTFAPLLSVQASEWLPLNPAKITGSHDKNRRYQGPVYEL